MPTINVSFFLKMELKTKKNKGAAVRTRQLLKHTVLFKFKTSVSACYDICCQESDDFIIKNITYNANEKNCVLRWNLRDGACLHTDYHKTLKWQFQSLSSIC